MGRVCPRCGRDVRVETLGITTGSTWLQCRDCGHLWREPAPGPDPFAEILARAALAMPVREPDPPSGRPRAARFQVRLHLRYRAGGDTQWRSGLTENISRSGLLFRARDPVEPSTRLDMRLTLPGTPAGEQTSQVCCGGSIVRVAGPAEGRESFLAALAAAVDGYRFNAAP